MLTSGFSRRVAGGSGLRDREQVAQPSGHLLLPSRSAPGLLPAGMSARLARAPTAAAAARALRSSGHLCLQEEARVPRREVYRRCLTNNREGRAGDSCGSQTRDGEAKRFGQCVTTVTGMNGAGERAPAGTASPRESPPDLPKQSPGRGEEPPAPLGRGSLWPACRVAVRPYLAGGHPLGGQCGRPRHSGDFQ